MLTRVRAEHSLTIPLSPYGQSTSDVRHHGRWNTSTVCLVLHHRLARHALVELARSYDFWTHRHWILASLGPLHSGWLSGERNVYHKQQQITFYHLPHSFMPTIRGKKTSVKMPKGRKAPARRNAKQVATRKAATRKVLKIKKGS